MKRIGKRICATAALLIAFVLLASLCLSPASFALTGGYMCGHDEEHRHTEACYDTVLICGKEEHLPLCGITEEHLHDLDCVRTVTYLECLYNNPLEYDEITDQIYPVGEHIHSEDCYVTEETLACGKNEHMHGSECFPKDEYGNPYEIHAHTSDCWQRRCVCGKEEHKHDPIICMFASFDGVENTVIWESTIPFNEFTGDWSEDVLAVAASQVGYTENFNNSVIAEDGKTRLGYTRYGHWFGYPYGDWCAMFGAFCLSYAGVPREAVPYAAGVETWIQMLQEKNILENASSYKPKSGDLIFIADDGAIPNHMGIVSEYVPTGESTGLVRIIQGNKEDAVKNVELAVPHWTVVGYVDMEKAHDKWLGIHAFEVLCGDETVKVKYLSDGAANGIENISAQRVFPESDVYEKAMNFAVRYLKKTNSAAGEQDIKLYELSGERNGAEIQIPEPYKVVFAGAGVPKPVAASFKMSEKTLIMLCG